MSSSYTTNLRITLQATGENAGTWGSICNTQSLQLLEDAITSFTSVATSAGSTTLSTNSGASDQARSAFLEISGSLTANTTVVVPSRSKAYDIRNVTTGAFSSMVKTATGTGVNIPQDSSLYRVVVDSVNTKFVNAVSASYATSAGVAASISNTMALLPVGALIDFAGTSAPPGWLFCFGQAISRTTYAQLFAAVSTTWGVGDNSTTFNVPDLRGRATFGRDNMGGSAASRITSGTSGIQSTSVGGVGGDQSLQAHSHSYTAPSGAVDVGVPAGLIYNIAQAGSTTGTTGGGGSQNMPPTAIVNKIIYTAV